MDKEQTNNAHELQVAIARLLKTHGKEAVTQELASALLSIHRGLNEVDGMYKTSLGNVHVTLKKRKAAN